MRGCGCSRAAPCVIAFNIGIWNRMQSNFDGFVKSPVSVVRMMNVAILDALRAGAIPRGRPVFGAEWRKG
ncbi:MAG: hypothetical protein DRH56_01950 [Deltaproteobacteria bacterium]|nr:MAG: hypothetical protein DRH56_01950 [Deltaproteobacteria bacterium]